MSGNARRSRNFFRDLLNWNIPGNEDTIKPEFIDTANLINVVYDNIVANGTTNATTTVLNYGVNVITTVTLTNNSAKLPQPVTGKTVKVVNMGTLPLQIFPSNVGGQINNYPIDAPAIVPPDGKLYEFICIENPLPGAWVWSAPAINQAELIEVVINHTNGVASAAYVGQQSYPGAPVIGLSGGSISIVPMDGVLSAIFPAVSTKTKVYTNILAGDMASAFGPDATVVERIVGYKDGVSSVAIVGGNDLMYFSNAAGYTFTNNLVVQAPVGSINSPILVGDTATFYSELNNSSVPNLGTGGSFSSYYWYYAINIPASAATKVYRFKIFVEYQ